MRAWCTTVYRVQSTVGQTGTGKAQAGWVAIAGKGDASRRLGEEKWLQSDARRREDGKFGTEGGARTELRVECLSVLSCFHAFLPRHRHHQGALFTSPASTIRNAGLGYHGYYPPPLSLPTAAASCREPTLAKVLHMPRYCCYHVPSYRCYHVPSASMTLPTALLLDPAAIPTPPHVYARRSRDWLARQVSGEPATPSFIVSESP